MMASESIEDLASAGGYCNTWMEQVSERIARLCLHII